MDELAGMRPKWLVRPLVWLAEQMTGPLFIVEFILFLIVWMSWNTLAPKRLEFDAWPFMGLNLFMSALAGIQAAVVGVRQTISEHKRQTTEDEHTAKFDKVIERIESIETDSNQYNHEILSQVLNVVRDLRETRTEVEKLKPKTRKQEKVVVAK